MRDNHKVENVRDAWAEKTLKLQPIYSQNKGRIANITRTEMATALQRVTEGQKVGTFRDNEYVLPILIKDVSHEYYDYSNIGSLPIMSSTGKTVSLDQVTEGIDIG